MRTLVEIFAGAGGAALGLERAGYEHLACIEWDADACETLRAAGLPCVEGDVRDPDLYESEWVGCDLLWSSFPCQAWSSAGKREGAKDERNMWPATVDAIDCLEPQWFAAENVTGLLQHRGACEGRCLGPEDCPRAYFDLAILAQLRDRFPVVQYRVLNASSFGVPQHRRRVFIVAGPRPIQWPQPTHGEPTTQTGLFGPGLLAWVTVRDALGLDGALDMERGAGWAERHGKRRHHPTTEPAPTVRAREGGAGATRFIRTEATGAVATPDTEPAPTVPTVGNQYLHAEDPGVRSGVRVIGGGTNPRSPGEAHLRTHRDLTDEPCTTITAEQIGNAGPWIESGGTQPGLLDRPSPTVSAVGECEGSGPGGHPEKMQRASDALYLSTGRRRLTVAECATLQGFPSSHPWQGTSTSRYKQVGNAVPPKMAELVGRAILGSQPSLLGLIGARP